MDRPVVLVTGCSSGIGRAAAKALRDRGCMTVATARDPEAIRDLEMPGHVDRLALDVSDEKSIHAAVAQVLERHGRIDALVNNAGYGLMLPLEEMPVAAFQDQFDVNVTGIHRMTRAVLPHMRAQEPLTGAARSRWRGRIVNISSAAGYVALPMMGAYSATKFAVRGMTYALHNEVRRHGVHASLVEPGRIRTRFGQRSHQERLRWLSDNEDSAYLHLLERWDDVTFNDRGKDVSVISRRIVHAATARRPHLHYRAPLDAKGAALAARFVPDSLLLAGVRRYFRR